MLLNSGIAGLVPSFAEGSNDWWVSRSLSWASKGLHPSYRIRIC